jgi:hypothetical protein
MKAPPSNWQPAGRLENPPRRVLGLILAICGAFLFSAVSVHSQTWETAADLEGDTGEGVYAITSDSAGNLFAAGYMRDATERYHAIILKSSDRGSTWETVVDYPAETDLSAPNGAAAAFRTITAADVGGERHLVATGFYRRVNRQGYTAQWLTIRSKDGGTTWETLDEYVHPTFYPSLPRDIAIDTNGNIYLVTLAKEGTAGTGNSRWLIRKGLATAGGMTWSMVGDFAYVDGYESAHGFDADGPSGVTCVGSSVFVVGSGAHSWIVRKSINGGSTWPVVDTYQFSKGLKAHAFDVAADSAGNVYVTGYAQKLGTRLIVRRLPSGGTKWATVDEYRSANATNAEGRRIAIDASNNVHVTGMATFPTSPHDYGNWRWVTRQRSATTGTWSITDMFSLATNQDSEGRTIAADPFGNLFSGGYGIDSAGVRHGWLVRRKLVP